MTVNVTRHGGPGPDDEAYAQTLWKGLARTIASLHDRPRNFGLALNNSLSCVQAWLAVNPDGSQLETWEAVTTAMQVHSAAFAAACATEGTGEYRINHELHAIPATGPQYYANAGNWLTAFWFAVVCRDQARMTQLCEIPLDVLRASGAEGDEYVHHWVDALQTYWLERPGLAEKLTLAIQTSHPDVATIAPRDLLQNILYQPINLFHRFLVKDHEAFNQALLEAVQAHKAYWTATAKREGSVEGYLALGPLAIACLAHDAGFEIDIETPYLPGELLRRAWLGEFPT
ncbi:MULTISPECIES: immunity 49 family protein [unclassified Streptomyces]|uniref:immunity 49 family protein n=1 Tax=unclassified Streptomyces TaxID=2593676 RepID=UPI0037FC8B6C